MAPSRWENETVWDLWTQKSFQESSLICRDDFPAINVVLGKDGAS